MTTVLLAAGLHGLDHPGRGDGDPGAEPGQRHPGQGPDQCAITHWIVVANFL
jgi:hypothetical protein